MVFGEPVYNTEQRRAILQQYKDYVDNLRKQKALSLWDVEDEQKEKKPTKNRRKNLSKIKKTRRKRKRKRRTTKKISLNKLRKLLCNDRYFK